MHKDEADTFSAMWIESETLNPVEPLVEKIGKIGKQRIIPICPRCGEKSHSWKRCIYCGQKFIEHGGGK